MRRLSPTKTRGARGAAMAAAVRRSPPGFPERPSRSRFPTPSTGLSPTGRPRNSRALQIDQTPKRRARAKTALNPRVEAVVSDSNQSLNLKTFGLTFLHPVVPPFIVFDAHIAASRNVIDIAARRRYSSSAGAADSVTAPMH